MTPAERLERSTWDMFWVPDDVTVIDRPELLALHSPRHLPYLNTVYRTRTADADAPAVVDEVCALHTGVLSRWSVVDTVDTCALERALDRAGYRPSHEHDARVLAVDRFTPRAASAVEVRRVSDEASLRDCWRASDAGFGRDGGYTDEDVAIELPQCTGPGARIERYVAYLDGEPVSSGGINLYPELSLGFLWAGATAPAARGRGAYSAVVAARIASAAAAGIRWVGLYARVATSSPIVAAQGFERVGSMTYWERPGHIDLTL